MSAYSDAGFTYVRDDGGVVHLADESPLGGLVTACDLFGRITVVDEVPDDRLCGDCREDGSRFIQ